MQSALDGLDATAIQPDWRDNNRIILQNNLAFMDDCLAKGTIAFSALAEFSKKQGPLLKKDVMLTDPWVMSGRGGLVGGRRG